MIEKNELLHLICSKDACLGILGYSHEQLSTLFGAEFARQKGYDQKNPHHCYDLLHHTVYCLVSVLEQMHPNERDRELLLAAALFHDLGKPQAMRDKRNRFVFYNHEKISAELSLNLLKEIGFCPEEVNKICFYIRYHGVFMPYKFHYELKPKTNALPIDLKNAQALYRDLASNYSGNFTLQAFHLLCVLAICDCEAQSKEVYIGDRLVDTKDNKIERIKAIQSLLNDQ